MCDIYIYTVKSLFCVNLGINEFLNFTAEKQYIKKSVTKVAVMGVWELKNK